MTRDYPSVAGGPQMQFVAGSVFATGDARREAPLQMPMWVWKKEPYCRMATQSQVSRRGHTVPQMRIHTEGGTLRQ